MDKLELIHLLSDPYFKNLELGEIFELAKKSIRLTADNCELKLKLDNINILLDDTQLAKDIKCIIDK